MLIDFENQARGDETPRFNLIQIGELEVKAPMYLIKGLLETDSLALLFGDPETFKSFLAIAWACCVATGTTFMGRAVKRGPVVYIAGEGRNGLARRFKAWAIRNKISLKDAPLFISTMPAGLCDAEQAQFVTDVIDLIAEKHGAPVLIVVDTLARNFGPGDENSTKDMNLFVSSCDAIRSRYRATTLIVHHTGHADKTRGRGSMALKGALDAEYRMDIDETGVIRFEATKMKDAEKPAPLAFRAVVVELGVLDEEGFPVTSVVLDQTTYEPLDKPGRGGRGKQQTMSVEILKDLIADQIKVSVSEWRAACLTAGMHRETFRRVLKNPPSEVIVKSGFVEIT